MFSTLKQVNNGRYEKSTIGSLLGGGLEIKNLKLFGIKYLISTLPGGGRGTSCKKLMTYLSIGIGALDRLI